MIVAGFGFTSAATVDSLVSALSCTDGPAPEVIATLTDKTASLAFKGLAEALCIPVQAVADGLARQQTTLSSSQASLSARGIASVAEACALAAAGPDALLLAPRVVSSDGQATCALAEGHAL